MQNQSKNSNFTLLIGVAIGSVAGMAAGAIISNLVTRLVGKNWPKITERGQAHQVDPRWLLQ